MLVVVLGPQTRLAKAVLGSPSWGSKTAFLLVTRNPGEYEAANLAQPSATLYRAWQPESPLPEENEAVAVVCCALGVIHPGAVVASRDLQGVSADHQILEAIVRKYANVPQHFVFISSVLALCPRPGREYYAGWKNVLQALVRHTAGSRRGVSVSVYYPGRLVEKRTLGTPGSFLHTSYAALAEVIVSNVRQNRSREAVLGLDSRLWLARGCVSLVWSALTGHR
jgi:hypothetical protein